MREHTVSESTKQLDVGFVLTTRLKEGYGLVAYEKQKEPTIRSRNGMRGSTTKQFIHEDIQSKQIYLRLVTLIRQNRL